MSTRDGRSVPDHVPPELQLRYGDEARSRVRAARQRDGPAGDGEASGQAERPPRIVLATSVAVVAAVVVAVMFSWTAAMVVALLLALVGVGVRVRGHRMRRAPPG